MAVYGSFLEERFMREKIGNRLREES